MPLTRDRVVYDSPYLHNGKEVVLFHNPLTLEEWEEILENQVKVKEFDSMNEQRQDKVVESDALSHQLDEAEIIVQRVKSDYLAKKELQSNFKGKNNKYDEIVKLEQIFLGIKDVDKKEASSKTSTTKD